MVHRNELVRFLDDLLKPPSGMEDSSNNGLQVEGPDSVNRAVFSVDASLELFERTASGKADFIFVHHGISWGDSLRRLTGIHARRLRVLFTRGISLYASHLPLDAHSEVGHNIEIARRLELTGIESFAEYHGADIGWAGRLPAPVTTAELVSRLNSVLSTDCTVAADSGEEIESVGIVSGGGIDGIADCADRGLSAFITGEAGHTSHHLIRESNITVILAGHYKTEAPGVEAVMSRVQKHFGTGCTFADIPTGL